MDSSLWSFQGLTYLPRLLSEVKTHLKRLGVGEKETFPILLCVEEWVVNAFRHGNLSDTTKWITLRINRKPLGLELVAEDQGPGFDPELLPDPTKEENWDKPSGRGICLIKNYASEFNVSPGTVRAVLPLSVSTLLPFLAVGD